MAFTTIDDPEAYFQVKIYTGTGSSAALTLDGDTDMQPDLVWIKERGGTQNNIVTDSVRGTNKNLYSDSTSAEAETTDNITAFGSDGFTVAGTGNETNGSSKTYVAWCWKESVTAGFDIVSFTGNATNRTISHSLSAVPKVVIVKGLVGTRHWATYTEMAGNTKGLYLNDTYAQTTETSWWNSTTPTSSVFTVGTSGNTNDDGNALIAYCFAEKQGFSKFGSYTGNGNADGPFLFCGFRPAMILGKNTSRVEDWFILDNKRDTFNPVDERLQPNSSGAESTVTTLGIDFCANGFKLRGATNQYNTDGETMIFMAFAEAPFVTSNGVPANAR